MPALSQAHENPEQKPQSGTGWKGLCSSLGSNFFYGAWGELGPREGQELSQVTEKWAVQSG